MKTNQAQDMKGAKAGQEGFSIIEVAVASLVTMIGLMFLASLFTLSITQNRLVKQFTSSTALAQEKIEELNAIDFGDDRLDPGGSLTSQEKVGTVEYYDTIYIDDDTGKVQVNNPIREGEAPSFRRFWSIQDDTELLNTRIIAVRVVSLQPGRGTGRAEETTLATVRSN